MRFRARRQPWVEAEAMGGFHTSTFFEMRNFAGRRYSWWGSGFLGPSSTLGSVTISRTYGVMLTSTLPWWDFQTRWDIRLRSSLTISKIFFEKLLKVKINIFNSPNFYPDWAEENLSSSLCLLGPAFSSFSPDLSSLSGPWWTPASSRFSPFLENSALLGLAQQRGC